ncbi:MAG: lysine--tRNA ligase [Candidatus Sumerlaeaceae bacterium]
MLHDWNEIIRGRYQKAQRMRGENIEPFVHRWNPTHSTQAVKNNSEALIASKETVRVAGRIIALRMMGKAAFLHLKDETGALQCYVKVDMVPERGFYVLKTYSDVGDLVGVEGEVFITRTGELTVLAHDYQILAKSMRPLPEKWHGLRDQETRYRQRYVDLIVNDHVRATFVKRSQIVATMRQYLMDLGYLEVETPMMHPICGGANARPFKTHHNALNIDLYLRIAPELYLKRLMVGGFEKIFEINRNFRNEGISTRHNPEFTMLELYTAYWDYRNTMNLTEKAIREVALRVFGTTKFVFDGQEFDLGPPFPRLTYLDAIRKFVSGAENLELRWDDPPHLTKEKIAPFFTPEFDGPSYQMIIDMFEALVEPQLTGPIFITEFAKAVSPLAKSKPTDPLVAERFELYIGGMEIANGYSELNDPQEQFLRFKEQMEARDRGDEEAHQMDEDYIRALEYGMPPASGLGIGIDRLVMILTNSPSIRDVILFPLLKPEMLRSDEENREQEPAPNKES